VAVTKRGLKLIVDLVLAEVERLDEVVQKHGDRALADMYRADRDELWFSICRIAEHYGC
jgi:hypothetical protein